MHGPPGRLDLSQAPSLRTITINVRHWRSWVFHPPQLTGITSLTLKWSFEGSSALSLLASFPLLERLSCFQMRVVTSPPNATFTPHYEHTTVFLTRLHKLELGFEAMKYLDLLNIVGPCDLRLRGNASDYRKISPQSLSNSVRNLSTSSLYWKEDSFLDFLRANSASLEEITIEKGPLHPHILELLDHKDHSSFSFPRFHRLSLGSQCSRREDTQATLDQFIIRQDENTSLAPPAFLISCHFLARYWNINSPKLIEDIIKHPTLFEAPEFCNDDDEGESWF